jgi:hypothetical protein
LFLSRQIFEKSKNLRPSIFLRRNHRDLQTSSQKNTTNPENPEKPEN